MNIKSSILMCLILIFGIHMFIFFPLFFQHENKIRIVSNNFNLCGEKGSENCFENKNSQNISYKEAVNRINPLNIRTVQSFNVSSLNCDGVDGFIIMDRKESLTINEIKMKACQISLPFLTGITDIRQEPLIGHMVFEYMFRRAYIYRTLLNYDFFDFTICKLNSDPIPEALIAISEKIEQIAREVLQKIRSNEELTYFTGKSAFLKINKFLVDSGFTSKYIQKIKKFRILNKLKDESDKMFFSIRLLQSNKDNEEVNSYILDYNHVPFK